jgi:hypothetical protein
MHHCLVRTAKTLFVGNFPIKCRFLQADGISCPSLSPIMFLVTWAVFRTQFLTPTKSFAKHTETINSAEWLHAFESKWYLPATRMQKLIKIHCAKRLPKRSNPCLFGWVFRYTGIGTLGQDTPRGG